jgi:hypothetical protein
MNRRNIIQIICKSNLKPKFDNISLHAKFTGEMFNGMILHTM